MKKGVRYKHHKGSVQLFFAEIRKFSRPFNHYNFSNKLRNGFDIHSFPSTYKVKPSWRLHKNSQCHGDVLNIKYAFTLLFLEKYFLCLFMIENGISHRPSL